MGPDRIPVLASAQSFPNGPGDAAMNTNDIRNYLIGKGSDVLIVCFDGAFYWAKRQQWAELGVGVITVEHGTTEMWGIENLARHLRERFPQIEFLYFAEHAKPWTVSAQ